MHSTANAHTAPKNKFSGQPTTPSSSKSELLLNRQCPGDPRSTATVWHYTVGMHAEKILQFGLIRGATQHVPVNERPVVWFSMDQDFEPTATKLKIQNGVTTSMSISEMIELGRGLVRFGRPPRTLFTGETLRKRARITSREWAMLKSAGLRMGADSRNWYGSVEPVDASLCTFEVMTKSGKWEPPAPSEWLLQFAKPA